MSRYFSKRYAALTPYVPGEQPQGTGWIKLNTNESPFPPSPLAVKMAAEEVERCHLYSDPDCRSLVKAASERLGVSENEVMFTNGSDDMLNFAFMAFCDEDRPAAFCDVTYGFYKVFAALNGVPYEEIPLKDDFTVDTDKFIGIGKTVFLANPNAPTGIALPLSEIERIVAGNPDHVVVVDEAYVDFGGESALPLTRKYDNLLVVRTFSKSRSLAGGRLGFGIACPALIADLNTLRFSTNPYNINRMTMAAGVGALTDTAYFEKTRDEIVRVREWTKKELRVRGFEGTDSETNFLFVRHPKVGGEEIYRALKEKGILVRHFASPRLKDYNRITVGSEAQMRALLKALEEIV